MFGLSKKAFQRLAVFYSDEEVTDSALELISYALNNSYIAKSKQRAEGKLEGAFKNGQYTHDFGVKEFKYYLDLAAKQYIIQFGESKRWYDVFPKVVRLTAAEMMASQWEAETGMLPNYEQGSN